MNLYEFLLQCNPWQWGGTLCLAALAFAATENVLSAVINLFKKKP